MAAPAWACRSAAKSPACSAANCRSARSRARDRPSPSTCRCSPPMRPSLLASGAPRTAPIAARCAVIEPTDDRGQLGKSPFVLIVEDDPTFAGILLDLAHEAGLKGIISPTGSGTIGAGAQDAADARSRSTSGSAISTGSCCSTCSAMTPKRGTSRSTSFPAASGPTMRWRWAPAEVIEKPAERATLAELFERHRQVPSRASAQRTPQAQGRVRGNASRARRPRRSSSSMTTSATSTR